MRTQMRDRQRARALLGCLFLIVIGLVSQGALPQTSFTEESEFKIAENLSSALILSGGAASSGSSSIKIIIESADAAGLAKIESAIKQGRGQIEAVHQDKIQAIVPAGAIEDLAAMPEVAFIRRPSKPAFSQGNVIGEGIKITGAANWHQVGLKGKGVKLAIVDAGFLGYKSLLGTELPPAENVITRSFRADNDIECRSCSRTEQLHGLAVAEVAHDIAPEATLYLLNFETDLELEVAVDWLIEEGVHAINTSFGFFTTSCPFEGFGFLDPVFERARESGIFWAASAGNDAQQHWAGRFSDLDENGFLNFSGDDESHTITGLQSGDSVTIVLFWDDPCSSRSPNDYDVVLENNSGQVIDRSLRAGPRNGWPLEVLFVEVPAGGTYQVKIQRESGQTQNRFSMLFLDQEPEYVVPEGTAGLTEPEISQHVVSVGATDLQNRLESFSSRGPAPDGRIKPDISAPDGVVVSQRTFGRFFGTSASSPHVAAAGALVKFAFPEFTPAQIQDFLESQAEDLGPPGKDNSFGSGLLTLGPAPFSLLKPPAAPSELAASAISPTEINISWKDNSNDEEGFSLSRRLESEVDPEVFITDANVTSFSDTDLEPATTYCYQVRAFNADGSSDPTGEVCAATQKANNPPVASAGEDQAVTAGDRVQLSGSSSSDPDGDQLSFAWELTSRPEGSSAALEEASSATPSFVPDLAGIYLLTLTVKDPSGASATDQVQVTANSKDEQQPETGKLFALKFTKLEFADSKQWERSLQSGCVSYKNISDKAAGIRVTLTDQSLLEVDIPSGNELLVCGDVIHIDTRTASAGSSSKPKGEKNPPPGIPKEQISAEDSEDQN